MYRLPLPDENILESYFLKYKDSLKNKIEEWLNGKETLPRKITGTKFSFISKLIAGSDKYNLVESLTTDQNLRILLIGDWDEMKRLTGNVSRIEPLFNKEPNKAKLGIPAKQPYTADLQIEDLNLIFKALFVDEFYEDPDKFDKLELTRLKGLKVCPYCGAAPIKNYRTSDGREIKPQIDHYLPKSRFPFLALNYNNLFPVCKNCNMIDSGKGERIPIVADFSAEYLPYPHHFDPEAFRFTGSYDASKLYDINSYSISIDYRGNRNLERGYNEITTIDPFYRSETQHAMSVVISLYQQNANYINLTQNNIKIDKDHFDRILNNCGIPTINNPELTHTHYKLKKDLLAYFTRFRD